MVGLEHPTFQLRDGDVTTSPLLPFMAHNVIYTFALTGTRVWVVLWVSFWQLPFASSRGSLFRRGRWEQKLCCTREPVCSRPHTDVWLHSHLSKCQSWLCTRSLLQQTEQNIDTPLLNSIFFSTRFLTHSTFRGPCEQSSALFPFPPPANFYN